MVSQAATEQVQTLAAPTSRWWSGWRRDRNPSRQPSQQQPDHVAAPQRSGDYLNFNDHNLLPFADQDEQSQHQVRDNGRTLFISGNGWKTIRTPMTVTRDTVLQFDFRSDSEGEIHGIGFGNANVGSHVPELQNHFFTVLGTQGWGISTYEDYQGNQWTRYTINVGEHFQGDFSYLVFANDHDVSNPNATSWYANVRVFENGAEEPPVEEPPVEQPPVNHVPAPNRNYQTINFGNHRIDSFADQDEQSRYEVLDNGRTLFISGNGWKKLDMPVSVTRDTVLQFDFRSDSTGEIHGIGFATENVGDHVPVLKDHLFSVLGTQDWGIETYEDYQGNQWTRYTINVGDHFRGDFNYLVFANDHDVADPDATSWFANVRIYQNVNEQPVDPPVEEPPVEEPPVEQPPVNHIPAPSRNYQTINFNDQRIGSFADQDEQSQYEVLDNGRTLLISGNGWKRIQMNTTVQYNTVLQFDFRSDSTGEIHGIGFASANTGDHVPVLKEHLFSVLGTQNWGIETYKDYRGNQWTRYTINVGEHFQGNFNSLVFANDHDVNNPDATSWFANVRVYNDANIEQPPAPQPPPTGTPDLPRPIREVVVRSAVEAINAIRNATPGTHILFAPNVYMGGMYFSNIHGTAENPIVIRSQNPNQMSTIRGGGNAMQFSSSSHIQIRDLIFEDNTQNGLNIDDGGNYGSTHHILVDNLLIRNIGTGFNNDGIKYSGVNDYIITNTTILNWGSSGSGIDLVGSSRGVIENVTFRHRTTHEGFGINIKGGSRDVQVLNNRFENAGARAIHIGGRTETRFFRPSLQPWEAKDVLVQGNEIIGGQAAITFANIDGGVVVKHNTIYRPTRYVFRILKENNESIMVNTRNAVITDNLIVWRQGEITDFVNVGPNTNAGSFQFARNWWYNESSPSNSTPSLPSRETAGVHGTNPQMVNPGGGNLNLRSGSPAYGYGASGA